MPRIATMIHTKILENNDKRKRELRSTFELIIVEIAKQSSMTMNSINEEL